ncbi:hypothetical protein I4U23_030476 [Adineta vaga]|nr:hypothetical protein I4U23_030476 [Adineta vaga]
MQPPKVWSKTNEPSSYDQIYKFLDIALKECLTYVNEIENEYYQETSAAVNIKPKVETARRPQSVNTLIAWAGPLNQLRNARLLSDIRNGKTARDLLTEARTGNFGDSISDETINLLKNILDKTNDQLHSKMPLLANKIAECMNLMEQYFLSFYDIENIQEVVQKRRNDRPPDHYVETAYTYEKSRWTHIFQVNKSMKILSEMQQRSEDTRGIVMSTLSKECQELAVRCDCTSLSYIFTLPECYIEARRAVQALRTWLNEDSKYTSFIQTSLKVLDEKFVEEKKNFEFAKAHLSHVEHRADSFQMQLNKAEKENEANAEKLEELEERLDAKERDYLSKRLTSEVYDDQLKKMLQAAEESDAVDNRLSIERFQQEIKQFARELPKLKAQMETIKGRIAFFKQRREELAAMRTEHKRLSQEAQVALEEKILRENEFNRVVSCRDILRNIYRCRSTNDLPQKIFYSLPIRSRRSGESENDDLSKAIRLTAKSIGPIWTRLYWQLPFYPARGQEEISKDIEYIDDKYHRGDVHHAQAADALNKWRRFHTRAVLDDLIGALRKVRRPDIVQNIERRILKPKVSINDIHEDVDPRKKEIEDLNRKLNHLFDKIKTGAITTHDTYSYSTIGIAPIRPVRRHRTSATH